MRDRIYHHADNAETEMTPKRTDTLEDLEFALWDEMRSYDVARLHSELSATNDLRRFAAATALHFKGGKQTLTYALSLCESPDPLLRSVAARVLGQLGAPKRPFADQSIPVLSRMVLTDPDADVRADAAAALGHLGSSAAIEVLTIAANDSDADVRANVAFAFGKIADPRAIEQLTMLLRDLDPEVRDWADIGLKQE
jgi:HEAT repeat protein